MTKPRVADGGAQNHSDFRSIRHENYTIVTELSRVGDDFQFVNETFLPQRIVVTTHSPDAFMHKNFYIVDDGRVRWDTPQQRVRF